MSDNPDQIAEWNGPVGERWAALQVELDALTRSFGMAALAAADPKAGEHVIDVGCGCGDTSLELARLVGADGVDVSKPMLEVAKRRAAGISQLSFAEADASGAALPGPFDLLFSRFGVMFFDDPPAAFAHLRRALTPNGRLAFVCWRARDLNPWVSVPLLAAQDALNLHPKADPVAPGPFAFADKDRLRRILESAGFTGFAAEMFEAPVYLGHDADSAANGVVRMGPVARLVRAAGPERLPEIVAAAARALAPHVTPQGVAPTGSTWIVTARAT
jgi:SAM-dependent methyltransferase